MSPVNHGWSVLCLSAIGRHVICCVSASRCAWVTRLSLWGSMTRYHSGLSQWTRGLCKVPAPSSKWCPPAVAEGPAAHTEQAQADGLVCRRPKNHHVL